MKSMLLPNVIIPGSQKSGTTSLCAALQRHPDCVVSNPKEPNFFSVARNESHLGDMAACFKHATGQEKIRVDGTTTYMADPRIGERLHKMLGGNLRIVFTLRSPAKRAWSGYLHMLKRGHERRIAEDLFLSLPTDPQEASKVERQRTEQAAQERKVIAWPYKRQYDDVLWNFRYVGNSLFREQVEVYDRLFGVDRVLVLLFEDLVSEFAAEKRKLAHFLDIDPGPLPDVLPRQNETKMPDTSRLLGRIDAQLRRIKNGNYTIVRKADGQAPARAPQPIDSHLRDITRHETEYWSDRMNRDLKSIGW